MPVKKNVRKPAASTKNKRVTKAQQNEHRELAAIIMFTSGLLLLCLVLFSGTRLWYSLHKGIFGIFGIVAYFIPVIFIGTGVLLSSDRFTMFSRHRIWQIVILISLLCGAVHIFTIGEPVGGTFSYKLSILYIDGANKVGGGLFGALLGWSLYALLGKGGASITIILALLAFVLLVTGSTLRDFFHTMKKPVDKISSAYQDHLEERIRFQEEKKKFNIDISLEDGPVDIADQLPQHPVTSSAPSKIDISLDDVPIISKRAAKKEKHVISEPANPNSDPIHTAEAGGVANNAHENEFDSQMSEIEQLVRKAVPVETVKLSDTKAASPFDVRLDDTSANSKLNRREKESVSLELDSALEASGAIEQYHYPPMHLLNNPKPTDNHNASEELMQNAELLVDTLKSFGVHTKILDISRGPTVTRYELQPSAGVKISKITSLADDIALNLATAGVRIEAPIPNKAAVGIEVPNKRISIVNIKEMIASPKFASAKSSLSVALGKDISGETIIADVGKMPHVLIAGATGSGKSVCINSIIISLLYKASPDDVRLLMIDPKVVELGIYNGIPHLLVPVVTDPRKAAGALNWAVTEMLNRYKLFADTQVRDIRGYNKLAKASDSMKPLPQIVIIIDELADLMMAAPNEVEDAICRLAQMARAAGMHLVIATQRPSVDVITGIIKANIPSRIAFAVSSGVDSRTILDGGGAEKLLGRGDMLFSPVGSPKPSRIQGCFVDDKEVERVVQFIKDGSSAEYDAEILDEIERQAVQEKKSGGGGDIADGADEMLPRAIECVVEMGQASTSALQRKLKLGYARAARIMDMMEERGIIGPFEGSKPRQVLITRDQWIEMNMRNEELAQ